MPVPTHFRWLLALLLLVSLVALTACGGSQPMASTSSSAAPASAQAAPVAEASVRIVDFAFEPATITIKPGTTVVWTNDGPTQHTVANKEGNVWESTILEKGGVYRFRFEKAGEYPYWCTLHPSMLGAVIVKE
jgi:plastocyanin